jgi:regulator of protease activity HflC (stomatin/prohibitin superfamily)
MSNPAEVNQIRNILSRSRRVIGTVILLILTPLIVGNLAENLDASHIMVVQSPVTGELRWYTTQGWKWQGFGKITQYRKRHQFDFRGKKESDDASGIPLPTRFNDNGAGQISGAISWEMPTATTALNDLHSKYGSDEAIERQIIRPVMEKVITMTGPLMSSTESFATRRNDMLFLILDQVSHGVYRTNVREAKVRDEMTGQEKTVKIVDVVPSQAAADHGFARQEPSALDEFQLRAFNLSLGDITYDKATTDQINAQQSAIMQVQTAIAESKKAEQAAITAAKNGEADAMKAKWEQEVIKAKEVTTAEQRRAVAALDAETAKLRKQEQILMGEGEAERRKLVMAADGALDKKLEAYVKVSEMYANAIANYKGAWVPSVQMGAAAGQGNGGSALIEMLTAKAAKDLSLDLSTKRP